MGTEALGQLTGRKGGSQTNTADNLFSTDNVEAILAISEGPIKGLQNGPQSFYVGDTPLAGPDGKATLTKYVLKVNKGSPSGEEITSRMGGFGSSTNVGVNLLKDVPVVRTGSIANIDYIDLRGAINALYETNKKGTFGADMILKIEFKAVSSSTWLPASSATVPPEVVYDNASTTTYNEVPGSARGVTSINDFHITFEAAQPEAPKKDDVWCNPNESYRPYVFDGTTFVDDHDGTGTVAGLSYIKMKSGRRLFHSSVAPWDRVRSILGSAAEAKDIILDTYESFVALIFNGSSWLIPQRVVEPIHDVGQGSVVPGGQPGSSYVGTDGVIKISGKTTSVYVRELRIPVPRINEPYQIRITKLSRDSSQEGDNSYGNNITWESFQEVAAKSYTFPNLASIQFLAQATGQFPSIPDFSGIYDGREVKVPTNYNPTTRVYTGVWDGTWKVEWTNNPAFIVKDLVENDRYGMNAYYPVVLDSTSVYLAGQHCDQYGFQFNGIISDPRLGKEAVNYICGMFGGRFVDDGNGFARILLDRSTDAVYLFAPENVVDGIFTYSFTEVASRFNDVTVTFTNPDLNWQEDRVRIFNEEHIAKYGRISTDFIAVGCTSRHEAIRRGRLHMITALTEKTMVNFKTNRAGLYLEPYDIVLISDDSTNTGQSGRVVSRDSSTQLTLRDPVYLEPGFSYKLKIQKTSPSLSVEEFPITSSSGSRTTLTVTGTLPTEILGVVTIESTASTGTPKAYRVITIEETEHPDNISISAIEVNRTKWDFVMTGIDDDDIDTGGPNTTTRPLPPTGLQLVARTRKGQVRLMQDLVANWTPPDQAGIKGYHIYKQVNSGPVERVSTVSGTQFELLDIAPAIYRIGVTSYNMAGAESTPVWASHDVIGATSWVPAPTNLRLVNGTSQFEFNTLSPRFEWDVEDAPFIVGFNVEIRDVISGETIREVTLDKAVKTYTYDYESNKEDHDGVPERNILIAVNTLADTGAVSQWAFLNVANPLIAPPADLQFVMLPYSFQTVIPAPSVPDIGGVNVWIGTTNPPTNLVYSGPDMNCQHLIGDGQTLYVQVGIYDTFRSDDAIRSRVFTVKGTGIEPASISWEHLKKDLYKAVNFNPIVQQVADYTTSVRERIFELKSETDGSLAYITQTIDARTGPEGSLTQIATSALSQTEDNTARLDTVEQTMTDNQTAVAGLLTELETSIGNNISTISDLVEARTGTTGTLTNRITNSESKIGDTAAARTLVENVTQASVDGSSLAAIIQTLGNSHGAIKTTVTSQTNTLGQLTNKYIVNMTSKGTNNRQYLSGFGMVQAGGSTTTNPVSTFAVAADEFVIGPPSSVPQGSTDWNSPVPLLVFNTSTKTFALNGSLIVGNPNFADGVLSGAKITPGTIAADKLIANDIKAHHIAADTITYANLKQNGTGVITENIAPNAVTAMGGNQAYLPRYVNQYLPKTEVLAMGVTLDKPGRFVAIGQSVQDSGAGNLTVQGTMEYAPAGTTSYLQVTGGIALAGAPLVYMFHFNLAAGTYVVRLTLRGLPAGGSGWYSYSTHSLVAISSYR